MRVRFRKWKEKKWQLMWAFIVAATTLVIAYFAINIDILESEEKQYLTLSEWITDGLGFHRNSDDDEVVFIDVTYDKELRQVRDEFDMEMGNTQVTDRRKLLRLLEALKENPNYRYVILDIIFPLNTIEDKDDSLFQMIAEVPRLIIPLQELNPPFQDSLHKKMGEAIYFTSLIESDFVKYPYITSESRSLPLMMYEDITGRKIEHKGLWFTEEGRPVRKSIFLTFDTRLKNKVENQEEVSVESENLTVYLLGRDLTGLEEGTGMMEFLPELIEDKYVIIGSLYGDDNHSSYVGSQPGPLILYNAFFSLMKGKHYISPWLAVFLFIIYFITSFMIITDFSFKELLREKAMAILKEKRTDKKGRRKAAMLLLVSGIAGWFSLTLILLFIVVGFYFIFGEVYDILISGIYLVMVSLLIRNIPKIKEFIRLIYGK